MKKIVNNRVLQISVVFILGLFLGWLIFASAPSDHAHSLEQSEDIAYTCSMHPQIRQAEPGKCPLCGMELIPVVQRSDSSDDSPFVLTMSPEAIALANIQTQKVSSVAPDREINLTGKVAINEQRLAVVTANYSGRIERLFVDFTGQVLGKGQKLATIYSPDLVLAQKELLEAAKYKDTNAVLYHATRQKLRLWKITEAQINEIERNAMVLTELDVYADRTGVVLRRNISKGDYVDQGAVLFEIADLSNIWILLDAYESDLPFLRVGQQMTISVASVPGKEFATSISFIDPLFNPQTRTASVRAELSNPQLTLKPEMFVKGMIKANVSVSDQSLVIPRTSLLWTGKRSVVYVKMSESDFPAFEMREIALGASLGDYYLVESGLLAGEEVVTNGVFFVDAAAQLRGNFSMMNRAADTVNVVPDRFTGQLTDVVKQYLELTGSFVKGDFQLVRADANKLGAILGKIDERLLNENVRQIWLKHGLALEEQIGRVAGAVDIENQREYFAALSVQLIETVEVFGVKYEPIYVAYCPVALGGKGVYWLSDVDEIQNPYLGGIMQTCGEITRQISGRAAREPKSIQPPEHIH